MISKSHAQTFTGWFIVVGHILIILYIFLGKSDTWDIQRQISAALTVAPVTAVYFSAVVKNFVTNAQSTAPQVYVNYNYTLITFFIPFLLLVAVFYVCYHFPSGEFSKPEQLQQALGALEIFLGGVVGVVVESLFRTEK